MLAGTLLLSALRLRELSLGGAPFALWLPFVKPLLSKAFELSLLVSVPAACVGAWCVADRLRQSAPALVAFSAALFGLSLAGAIGFDLGTRSAGTLAQELIETGRDTCERSRDRKVHVPIVSVAWACPPGASATVSGKAPTLPYITFSGTALRVSPDLRELQLENARLDMSKPPARELPGVRALMQRARIRGLPPWGRPATVSMAVRLAASLLGAASTLVLGVFLVRFLRGGFWIGASVGFAGGAVGALAQAALDRGSAHAHAYWWASAAGPFTLLLGFAFVFATKRVRVARSTGRW